jgi:hypothetical protein
LGDLSLRISGGFEGAVNQATDEDFRMSFARRKVTDRHSVKMFIPPYDTPDQVT